MNMPLNGSRNHASLEHRLAEVRFGTRLAASGTPVMRSPWSGQAGEGDEGSGLSGPAPGRMYTAWLKKGPAFETDRVAAAEVGRRLPWIAPAAAENREFVERAVAYAAGEGYTRFVDVGAGAPVHPMVHEIARAASPYPDMVRVVYVDVDTVITAETAADLAAAKTPGVAAITQDLRAPGIIWGDSRVREVMNPGRPVCLILTLVLHFVSPDEAREAMEVFRSLIVSGSLVVISAGIAGEDAAAQYNQVAGNGRVRVHPHTREHVAGYFTGLDMVEPGLVPARCWRPDGEVRDVSAAIVYAGVARKP